MDSLPEDNNSSAVCSTGLLCSLLHTSMHYQQALKAIVRIQKDWN